MTRPARLFTACLCLLAAFPALAADDADAGRLIAELGLQESAVALSDRPGWQAPRKIVVMGADAEIGRAHV